MNKEREPNLKRIDKYFDLSAKKERKIIFRISCLTAIPFILIIFLLLHLELITEKFEPLLIGVLSGSYIAVVMIAIWLWEKLIPDIITQKRGEQFWCKAVDVMVTRDEDNRKCFHVIYECSIDSPKKQRVGIRSFNHNPVKTMKTYYIRGFKYRKHYVLLENKGYIDIEQEFVFQFRL